MNINLDVDVTEKENETTLHLKGEIDAYTAPLLKEKLLPLTAKQDHHIIVDLAEVSYMDSTGLGVFISALKSTKEHDAQLKLVNLQERVHRLFKITSLDTIITIETTVRGGN
ncbi:anti-sigma B factor antagonist [Streptohalobacillus salinus]|uniref:Anti-sigma factor antagonist n=1 Tax=Streptohalobacillus salinus TaxID=621096 RepID=A0A2V3WAI9_9BACI|nr:STAS domain-containing protein [Streptohalobacillus salinus]PXW89155.1 anti-sigma B factor antagonist [Streptohalobacillus salinus]